MPNHVTHKIIFDISAATEIFTSVCPDGKFDFEKLIPVPLQMYRGDISSEDEADFSCNWMSWQVFNWGTKWNAYDQSCGFENGKAFIKFNTAWSVPYPIISAFANRFKIAFEHRYFDEGGNFWGIELWGFYSREGHVIHRIGKKKNDETNYNDLCIELKGYDPREDESEGN